MDTGQFSWKSDKMLGSNLGMDQYYIQGGVVLVILLVVSRYENPDKLPQDQGHLAPLHSGGERHYEVESSVLYKNIATNKN